MADGSWTADEALEQLYAAHWRQLVRLSVLLVRDVGTAEEVVQDAFVAVHRPLGPAARPRQGARLPAAGGRQPVALGAPAPDGGRAARRPRPRPGAEPDHPAEVVDRRAAVLEAMRALPQRQREVLALRYYLDLSEAEIAETLGISRGAVKSHASRGSAALRELLKERACDDDDLRDLLTDAVSDVEPAYRLGEIQARTHRPAAARVVRRGRGRCSRPPPW